MGQIIHLGAGKAEGRATIYRKIFTLTDRIRMKLNGSSKLLMIVAIMAIALLSLVYLLQERARLLLYRDRNIIAEVRQDSLWKSFSGGKCAVTFIQTGGITNRVAFYQDFFQSPTLFVPGADSNVLFCVYYNDVDWQLIKIDLSQPFSPLARDNPVAGCVQRSTCKIERVLKVNTNDWKFVANALGEMPVEELRIRDISVFQLAINKNKLIKSMHNFGDQWQYVDDPF